MRTRSTSVRADLTWVGELYRREHHGMARRLRLAVSDPDDAADLLQDAFERLAGLAGSTTPATPKAYLGQVIRNLVIDRARRAHRRADLSKTLSVAALTSVAPDQAHILEAEDLMRQYRAVVDALSPRTREVFLLHRVDELTYAEIGRQLGITVATVEYHITRALFALGQALHG